MNPSRRNFLLQSSLAAGSGYWLAQSAAVQKLVQAILADTFRAQAAGLVESKYVCVMMPGAPPRWIFDHLLATKPSEIIRASPMAATAFVSSGGTYTSASHQAVSYNGFSVPPLWNTNVTSASGSQRPLSELLNHLIVFRGFGTGVDGHSANAAYQTNPVPAAGSISGHMADHSQTIFKAMQFPNLGQSSGYSSILGTGLTTPLFTGQNTNYISQILYSFSNRSETSALNSLRQTYSALVSDAQRVLQVAATKDHSDFRPVHADYQQAVEKIKVGVNNLTEVWDSTYGKYLNIAQRTFKDRSSPGFNDKPIITSNDDGNIESPWSLQGEAEVIYPAGGQDIRDWVNQVDVSSMAATFALAEFVLTTDMVSAYEMNILQPANLIGNFVRGASGSFGGSVQKVNHLIFDQHGTGLMTGLFLNSCLFRSLGACLLELVDRLKETKTFNQTAIHLTQEFGRIPRDTLGGSDHGFDGMISSVLTGLQQSGPAVVGNILSQGSNGVFNSTYSGAFGYKAPTMVSGLPTLLTPAHVASTFSYLLKLPNDPWGNVAAPLVTVNGSKLEFLASGQVVTV